MSLLGIDIGTGGCKAAAFSAAGRCLASAYREYPSLHPRSGWLELDARLVWQKTKQVIAEVAGATAGDLITALCTSSMGEAMVPVAADGTILGNSILQSDIRGGPYVDALREKFGAEPFYRINPNILGTNYSLPKLLWLKEHQSDLFRQADRFLLWGDMVAFMLAGKAVTSYSLANRTLLLDIRKEQWSQEILDFADLDVGKLPALAASGTIVGEVSASAAAELGLPPGVAIVVGGHDQACNSLGAGIIRAGTAVCGIGTFECITPTFDHLPPAEGMLQQGLNIEHHLLPGLYVSFLYNQGGCLVRWFRDTFAGEDRKLAGPAADVYELLAREMPAGPTSLLTLPYFEITGPPGFTRDAGGAIVNLKTSTTRGEILKSIMECETLYFADAVAALRKLGIDTTEFVATGGGARSDAWLQIKADIFGVPFIRPRITEGSVLGAAMLAGLATGVFSKPADAVERFVQRERTFDPDPSRHRIYQDKLNKYRKLYPALKELLGQMQ